MKAILRAVSLAIALAGFPAAALAHVGVGDAQGLMHGFAHPITGIDHILAMVAVGMFAAYLGGKALWLVPASFVLMMAAGGTLGVAGVPVPFVEIGIAASVIVLGLAIAVKWSLPTIAAMGLVGFFAIFHGHAHGAEMPASVSGIEYALGFMLATALLHMAGMGIGLGIGRIGLRTSELALRASGSVIALAGMGILTGYL
jgi:urease accessory protein